MGLLLEGDLVQDILLRRRETRHSRSLAGRDRADGLVFRSRSRGRVGLRQTRSGRRIEIELGLKILKVEGKIQNGGFGVGGGCGGGGGGGGGGRRRNRRAGTAAGCQGRNRSRARA